MLEYYKTNEYSEDEEIKLNEGNSEEISTKRKNEKNCNC